MSRHNQINLNNLRGEGKWSEDLGRFTATNIRFEWNYLWSTIAQRKGINKEFYKEAGQILREYMEPYVPKRTGDLVAYSQVFASKDGATINYQKDYAYHQYTGGDKADEDAVANGAVDQPTHWHRATLGTTSYWDKAAWAHSKNLITRDIEEARRRYAHH